MENRCLFRPVLAVLQCIKMAMRMISDTKAYCKWLRSVTRHQGVKNTKKTVFYMMTRRVTQCHPCNPVVHIHSFLDESLAGRTPRSHIGSKQMRCGAA